MNPQVCTKCGGQMFPGKALADIMTGTPDFPGDDHVCTVSPSGRAELVDCLKCNTCGFSVSSGCGNCERCLANPFGARLWMILCPDCGNKRCPKARDCRNSCTGSNEPGQVGEHDGDWWAEVTDYQESSATQSPPAPPARCKQGSAPA